MEIRNKFASYCSVELTENLIYDRGIKILS